MPAHPEPGELLRPSHQALALCGVLRPTAKLYRLGAHALTPAVVSPSTAERSEAPSSVREYMTILPSLRERTRSRERSAPRWCETRFCERPTIHESSHTHNSPPSRSASASVRRVGSERAFARSAASRVPPWPSSFLRMASARGASMQIRSQRSCLTVHAPTSVDTL